MAKKIGIVTGASSGIGREFVKQLDSCLKHVDEIWVIARRRERLIQLQEEMTNISLRVLSLDICKREDIDSLVRLLDSEQPAVRLLINAAGVGRSGRFDMITRQEAENMVSLNAQALVTMTSIILPYMKRPGNIIQLASASAFMPQKEFAVYAASKAFVLSFSRALRAELLRQGIGVTIVCPGPVDTEFLTISNKGNNQKFLKKLTTVKPEPVVAKALRDAKRGKELSIYGLPMKAVYAASKVLPFCYGISASQMRIKS